MKDLRYALRTLAKNPGFAATAVATLAIGIGANTAIFSVLDAVLFKPLPFPEGNRLVVIWPQSATVKPRENSIAPPEFADISSQQRAFEGVAAIWDRAVNLTGSGEPVRLQAFAVSPNLPAVLRVTPALGRSFRTDEGRTGGARVAMLGHDLWRTRFASDPAILNKAIVLDGNPTLVIGVLPPGVRFPEAGTFFYKQTAQLWIPVAWHEVGGPRGDQYLSVVGRRKAGVTPGAADADLDRVAAGFRAQYPDRYSAAMGWTLRGMPLAEEIVGGSRAALLVVAGAVGLLLLIACADVASLLLARAANRRREFAVRIALGADGRMLLTQLLTESLVLALAGGALGTLLAVWGVDLLVKIGPADLPRLADAAVGLRVLLFTVAVSAAAGAVFGLAPARQVFATDTAADLKGIGLESAAAGRLRGRGREAIVVGQVAIALVVAAAAGLLVASFARLTRVDPGFRSDRVLTLQTSLPRSKYADRRAAAAFYTRLLERLAALPGVTAAGGIDPLPFSGDGWSGSYRIEGRPLGPDEAEPHAAFAAATPDYFRAMTVPLRAGRFFAESDGPEAPKVVVVDERLARRDWPGEDPVGKRVLLDDRPLTVIGVVGHVRYAALEQEGEPQLYLPVTQWPRSRLDLVVATAWDPLRQAAAAREAVRSLDPDVPTGSLRSMNTLLDRATSKRRFQLTLIGLFALAALLLAAVGLSGLLAQMVAARTREIGIRRALGASRRDVLALVAGRGLLLAGAGVSIGLVAAWGATRLLSSLLFGVSPTDLATFAGVALLLLTVAGLAALLPAWRAVRVDPLIALRQE